MSINFLLSTEMDIENIKTIQAGNDVIIKMRNYKVKNDIIINETNNDDIYYEIVMKDNIKFIIDKDSLPNIINIKYKDLDEFTAKWYLLNERVACIISGTKKVLYLDEYLVPSKDNLVHIHLDNNKLNYKLSNIKLVNKGLSNTRAKKKIITNQNIIKQQDAVFDQEIIDNTQSILSETIKEPILLPEIIEDEKTIDFKSDNNIDFSNYHLIKSVNNYNIFENNNDNTDKIVEITASNNKEIKFIIDFNNLEDVIKYNWNYNSKIGYMFNNSTQINKSLPMTYLHSFIYFINYPDTLKQENKSIHHKNLNKLDNRIKNLDYVNQSIQNAIRQNTIRYSKKINRDDIKNKIPKFMSYYPPKDNFSDYFEIDIKPFGSDTFKRLRTKTTKSKDCTIIEKLIHGIIIRYEIIKELIETNQTTLQRFCLESNQFNTLNDFKDYSQNLLNNLLNEFTDEKNNKYTIEEFLKYIKEKSKKKANSGSFVSTK